MAEKLKASTPSKERRGTPPPRELGGVASDEANYLSLTAARKRKMMEMGERRRGKWAHKHNATAAALRGVADALPDVGQSKGTGADGRATLRDMQKAQSS